MIKTIDTQQAGELAELLIENLKERGGFGPMWFELLPKQQQEIKDKFVQVIRTYCKHLSNGTKRTT